MLRQGQHDRGEVRYSAANPATLRIVPLDTLTAIYHRTSGVTHIVDAPVPELLAALTEPMTPHALLTRLAAEYDMPDADPAALAERLAELEAVGLVTRA